MKSKNTCDVGDLDYLLGSFVFKETIPFKDKAILVPILALVDCNIYGFIFFL